MAEEAKTSRPSHESRPEPQQAFSRLLRPALFESCGAGPPFPPIVLGEPARGKAGDAGSIRTPHFVDRQDSRRRYNFRPSSRATTAHRSFRAERRPLSRAVGTRLVLRGVWELNPCSEDHPLQSSRSEEEQLNQDGPGSADDGDQRGESRQLCSTDVHESAHRARKDVPRGTGRKPEKSGDPS